MLIHEQWTKFGFIVLNNNLTKKAGKTTLYVISRNSVEALRIGSDRRETMLWFFLFLMEPRIKDRKSDFYRGYFVHANIQTRFIFNYE